MAAGRLPCLQGAARRGSDGGSEREPLARESRPPNGVCVTGVYMMMCRNGIQMPLPAARLRVRNSTVWQVQALYNRKEGLW